MPTTRPRHQVTETPTVARALDEASHRWPGVSRGQLLVRLVEAGAGALASAERDDRRERARLIDDFCARHGDLYAAGYLDDLREDWSR